MFKLAARIFMVRNWAISPRASSSIESCIATTFRPQGESQSVAPEMDLLKEVQSRNSAKRAQDLLLLTVSPPHPDVHS